MNTWSAVGKALGSAVTNQRSLTGGDINEAWAVSLADGREVFVKTNARADAEMFPTEARGLAFLDEANALRIPEVLAVGPRFLALEFLKPGPRVADFDDRLGRGLAALHQTRPETFGLDHDNFIGRLPQSNAPSRHWPDFYREQRLEAQLRSASDRGLVDATLGRGFDALFTKLEDRVGPPEPPARLHGDLWGGNLHVDAAGLPALIDPAVYGGHREVDLAMMSLFGGFSRRVFEAYDEAFPLAEGWQDRVPLYQLYPLLVHVNLFGGGYVASVSRALAAVK